MSTPFFSVIMTSYNRAALLRLALRSLEGQTFKDFEAFIIDDGSRDGTPGVLEEYRGRRNWQCVSFKENRGYPFCKNYALQKAAGRYITFLDSDDVWLPGRLEAFRDYVSGHPEAGFIFSNGYVHQDGRIIGLFSDGRRKIPEGKLPPYMAVSNRWLPYVTTNVAIKKETADAAGLYRETMTYLGDTEYFARAIKSSPVGYIPRPLSVYRIHAISLTRSWDECMEESLATIESAAPPRDIAAMLASFVYYHQATVLLKNGFREKARDYLARVKGWRAKVFFLRALTYTPSPVLSLLRIMYKSLRAARLITFPPPGFREVERFLDSLEPDREN